MAPTKAIVFDLYGTLFDVHSVVQECDKCFPGKGTEISSLWRHKQLEYTWLRSLMGQYIPFEQATRDALIYVARHLELDLDAATTKALCDAYLKLSPHPEVPQTLQQLNRTSLPLCILSNGSEFSIRSVVEGAGLARHFSHLLSVDEVGVFKPDPRVYTLACRALGVAAGEILFVSSNAWDASGAAHFGFNVCWVNRQNAAFDELGASPAIIVKSIGELPKLMA
ncbi:haloacid dehalogenase type II [Bordetella sp. BOR01]|uniref:haloacid dehalogenase type II n=1 Tax=Bordetella sp. BOR01 TaxID=2854779 RepID=UPI001C490618|nr:haloacid dehalogenase type II [Bordetella sp. BOR01]MBV7483438.1 haloacid dehalogenase type II [Bordetella sp. BOR01]